jgi:oligopeptide/dipeptide ABC transporter ATP-binding protein
VTSELAPPRHETADLLAVRDLETAFATKRGLLPALRGVSLTVARQETVGVVGESGSGKSVTALSIMRLLPSSGAIVGGSVELAGRDMLSLSKRELQRVRGKEIAMVFQDSMTSLNPVLTVGRQLTESLSKHLGLGRSEARARALDLLREVGIPEPKRRLRQYPHQLSGGLRQRVAIAIALAANPAVLIADEPTTALDVTIQAQILDLLRREQDQRGMAMLLITHDLGVIAGMVDRVCVMYGGRIVELGATDLVFKNPSHPYTVGLLRSVPRLDATLGRRLISIAGSPPPIGDLPTGCPFRTRCQLAFDRCASEEPPLIAKGDDHAAACWADVRELALR